MGDLHRAKKGAASGGPLLSRIKGVHLPQAYGQTGNSKTQRHPNGVHTCTQQPDGWMPPLMRALLWTRATGLA